MGTECAEEESKLLAVDLAIAICVANRKCTVGLSFLLQGNRRVRPTQQHTGSVYALLTCQIFSKLNTVGILCLLPLCGLFSDFVWFPNHLGKWKQLGTSNCAMSGVCSSDSF